MGEVLCRCLYAGVLLLPVLLPQRALARALLLHHCTNHPLPLLLLESSYLDMCLSQSRNAAEPAAEGDDDDLVMMYACAMKIVGRVSSTPAITNSRFATGQKETHHASHKLVVLSKSSLRHHPAITVSPQPSAVHKTH